MEFERKVIELDVNDVLPNRFQPRIKFNEDSINELSDSIKEHGVIQPIVVRAMGDKYEIIAGERRYKASLLAGKSTIPAVITNLNDKDSAEVALIENVQRKDLTPIEEAISYKKILDMGYLTQEELAVKLGKSQSTVANKLRLLNLDEDVQEAVLDEKISERHARSLLKLSDFNDQKKVLRMIIDNRLTVRKTDEEIAKILNSSSDDDKVSVLNPTYVDNPFNVKRIEPEKMVNVEEHKINKFMSSEPIVIMEGADQMPAISEDDIAMLLGSDNSIGNSSAIDPILGIPTSPIEDAPVAAPVNDEPLPPVVNPGFMNIDNIENNAQDINVAPKAPADINSLLQPSIIGEPAVTEELPIAPVVEETPAEELKVGKFFNLPTEEDSTSDNVSSDFQQQSGLPDSFNFELNMINQTNGSEPVVPSDLSNNTASAIEKIENLMEVSNSSDDKSSSDTIDAAAILSGTLPIVDAQTVAPISDQSANPVNDLFVQDVNTSNVTAETAAIETPVPTVATEIASNDFNLDDLMPTPVTLNEPVVSSTDTTATADEVLSLDSDESSTSTIAEAQLPDTLVVTDVKPQEVSSDELPIPTLNSVAEANKDVNSALLNVRDVISNLERSGYIVDTEELDFEGEYQIIIKIKK